MSSSLDTELVEAEARLADASARFSRMHSTDADFLPLSKTIPLLEQRVQRLRSRRAAAEFGLRIEPPKNSESVDEACRKAISALCKAIAPELLKLDARLAALEERPAMRDAGIWEADKAYEPGDVVSYGGSGWVAKHQNRSAKGLNEPGAGNDVWRCFIRRGRDGAKLDQREIRAAVRKELETRK